MASPTRRAAPFYRRRILGIGVLIAVATFIVGAAIFVNRIESDLEQRVPTELAEQGFVGVDADFSGQDGTLSCGEPLGNPQAATKAAYDVWGVRSIQLDSTCRVRSSESAAEASGTGTDTLQTATTRSAATTTNDEVASTLGTIADIVATDTQFSHLAKLLNDAGLTALLADPAAEPMTLFAPTDDAFNAIDADTLALLQTDPNLLQQFVQHILLPGMQRSIDLQPGPMTMADGHELTITRDGATVAVGGASIVEGDLVASNGIVHAVDRVFLPEALLAPVAPSIAPFEATYDGATITLAGVVATEVERIALVTAATDAVGAGNVADQIAVDLNVGLDAATVATVAQLMAAMPGNLATGAAGFDGTTPFLRGTYTDDAGRAAAQAAADAVAATAALAPPQAATDADAAALESSLNEFVAANPIRFEPSSAVLTADAEAVLDQIAAQASALTGVAITIEGHTDSDGQPDANLALSQRRAEAVLEALVARGLDPATFTAEGFGSQVPVLSAAGVEDKDASRRVEFRIEATT